MSTAEPMLIGSKGISPANVSELQSLAEMMVKGGLFKGSPIEAACVVGMGAELGLSPFQSIQVIKSINGKFSVFGDGITALLHASGKLAAMREEVAGEGDERTATCSMSRHGVSEPIIGRFSVADAKRAGLWGKAGPWSQYPERMLQMRARGFAARDGFSDVLRGLISAEEAMDYPKPTVATSKPLPGTAPKPTPTEPARPDPNPLLQAAESTAEAHSYEVLAIMPEGSPWPPEPKQVQKAMDAYAKAKNAPRASQGPSPEPPKGRLDHLRLMGVYLGEIFPDDTVAMSDYLQELSSFEGKDGKPVKGFNTLKAEKLTKVSDKWIETTYHKVKDVWLEATGQKPITQDKPAESVQLSPVGAGWKSTEAIPLTDTPF